MEVRHNYKIKPFGEAAEKGLSSGIMRLPDFCYLECFGGPSTPFSSFRRIARFMELFSRRK